MARDTSWTRLTCAMRWLYASGYLEEWVTTGALALLAFGIGKLDPTERRIIEQSGLRDPSLMYPDDDSLVPSWALFLVCFLGPGAVMTLASLLQPIGWLEVHHVHLAVVQAVSLSALFKRSINVAVGRHRPNWYSRVAKGVSSEILNARMSYPSGHTAFSYASMGVMTLFLLGKLRALQRERWQMLTLLGSLAPVALATCIAVSRLVDYHHNFSDVNAGTFLGVACALLCYQMHFTPLWSLDGGGGVARTRRRGADEAEASEREAEAAALVVTRNPLNPAAKASTHDVDADAHADADCDPSDRLQ